MTDETDVGTPEGGVILSADGALAGAGRDLSHLRRVDGYDLGRELARGGMGRILEAHDRRHDRRVAIKVLLHNSSDEAVRRFLREAALTARLSHPGIIPLYEVGVLPSGEPFYAMKLVAGGSLGDAIADTKGLRDRLALLPHVVAVAGALGHAHGQGVVHRDLKPANVLIGPFGETVVIDWGVAKDLRGDSAPDAETGPLAGVGDDVTVAGRAVGTRCNMPPEQARGEPPTPAVDVYALGAVLYHVCAGAPPYGGRRPEGDAPPAPIADLQPDLPLDLVAIVEKAMARAPRDRYPDAAAVAADLEAFMRGDEVAARRYDALRRAGRWLWRRRAPLAATLAVLLVVATAGAIGVGRVLGARDLAQAAAARADAERALAVAHARAAEELVDYIYGDLRASFTALGRQDLLRRVGTAVDAYRARVYSAK